MCCYGNTKQSIRYATQLIVIEEVDMLKEGMSGACVVFLRSRPVLCYFLCRKAKKIACFVKETFFPRTFCTAIAHDTNNSNKSCRTVDGAVGTRSSSLAVND